MVVPFEVDPPNGLTLSEGGSTQRLSFTYRDPNPSSTFFFEVEYTFDGEGVLTVKARDLGTGKENEIRILDLPKGMEE